MAPPTWKLLFSFATLSSSRQCSATETCDDHSALLQSHVTSHKSSYGTAAEQGALLDFPKVSSLADPAKRKAALAQFEITAKELALNAAAVTPVVVEICNATAEMLRDTVMSAIINEHDTDVAMLGTTYAAFGPIEEQRLEYERLINEAIDAVYGTGGLIAVHRECRITENQECVDCGVCEDSCHEREAECETDEETLRLALEDVVNTVDEHAYCDEHGNIHPPSSTTVITYEEHTLNIPPFNAYLDALAAYQECVDQIHDVCEHCEEALEEEAPVVGSLLAISRRQSPIPGSTGEMVCPNHTAIRTQCNTIQEQLQAAQCQSRHMTFGYLSLYEAAFLAAVERYNHQKASVMIMVEDRKVEWDTLERVICLLMTLTNNTDGSASSAATAANIEGCQNDFVDTSHLDILYHVVPEMGDLPGVPHNPCGDEFAGDAYPGLLECGGITDFLERYDHGLLTDCSCEDEHLEEAHYGFPYELGPYLLFEAGLELNSVAGFEVTVRSDGTGTAWVATSGGAQYSGRLSPFVAVTLPELDAAFGLGSTDSVAQVAWAYGDPQGTTDMVLHGEEYPETMQHRFVRTGGFVYRNAQGFVVALKIMSPSASALGQDPQLTLFFDSPREITESLARQACPEMSPIALGRLLDAGAEEYCWEFEHTISFCEHGCFVYKTATHGFLAFPVTEAPADDVPPAR